MQLIKMYDKYDRELFLDLHHAIDDVVIIDKRITLMRRIMVWLQKLMCKMLLRLS